MDKRSLIFVVGLSIVLYLVHEWFSAPPAVPPEHPAKTEQVAASKTPPSVSKEPFETTISKDEQFYVLENEYQQLVFSTLGGALSEINLPLRSKENQASAIRPIEFDKVMKSDYPSNDRFPSFPSMKNGSSAKVEGTVGGYYPLLRRNILSSSGFVEHRLPPKLYALNVVSEDPEEKPALYRVKKFEKDLIEFESSESNRKITKTFSLPKDAKAAPYCLDLVVKIEGEARGLWITSGVPEVELISGSFSPSLQYRLTRKQKSQVDQADLPKTSTVIASIEPDWVSNSNGFLGLIMDPMKEIGSGFSSYKIPGEVAPTRLTLIDAQNNLYPADKYPGYEIRLPLRASGQTMHFRVFAGPFENTVLKTIDATYSDPTNGYNPDYISTQTFHGWFSFISEPFAKFLFLLMNFFYKITSSWGISIILLTIALRIMLYPLNAWSIKSTAKMQQIGPLVANIQEKYKKEPKRAQMEIMNLYKEKKINPLSGCFPLLIQMPFLIGMFDLLKSTFELRGAVFIPHWIDNLTAPDVVFSWNYPIPFFGTDFHLLPVLLGAVMYFQQKFSSPLPKDKTLLTDQQKQQKMMGNIMTIVFTVMFYHFPSGLNLYWLSSMLLGILQQWWTSRSMKQQMPVKTAK